MAISDEFLFYIGAAALSGAVLFFIVFSLIFHIRKIRLNEQFDREYGSRLGKDGHPAEQVKRRGTDSK